MQVTLNDIFRVLKELEISPEMEKRGLTLNDLIISDITINKTENKINVSVRITETLFTISLPN